MRGFYLISAAMTGLCCLLTGCMGCGCGKSTSHIPAVTNFDPERFAGTWYEIARLPHWFERDLKNVRAEYALRPDGRIDVVNRGTNPDGKEKVIRGIARKREGFPPSVGELEVSFFGPFYGPYRILYLKDDASLAMVTSDTMDYFWILSRTPSLPDPELQSLLTQAQTWGFSLDNLQFSASPEFKVN